MSSDGDRQRPPGRRVRAFLTRRGFVKTFAGAAGIVVAPAFLRGVRADVAAPGSGLFALGVMSGEPRAGSVVLWTRLAPDPLAGGGMPRRPVPVRYEVATDPGMVHVVRRGAVVALPRNGHAVHALVHGLPGDGWLYYRFHALGEWSPIGRTRTFPRWHQRAERLRFAFVSCQDYEQGFYPAWRDLAALAGSGDDLDCVVHLGDYIYENAAGADLPPGVDIGRRHEGPEIFSLEDYRNRYALYRLDANLQRAQALFPFVVTPDDHEVDNGYAGTIAEEGAPFEGEAFVERRRNAYRAYAEAMPLRPYNRLGGRLGRLQLFRGLDFGDLARIHVLDTRQFRTDQPADDVFGSTDPDSVALEPVFGETLFDADGILDPDAQLLGRAQERWLERSLRRSRARWNVLAQQVMVTRWNLIEAGRLSIALDPGIPPQTKAQILALFPAVENLFNVDAWDGYQAARGRLFEILRRTGARDPVVLTGDIHSSWGANLLEDFSDPGSRMLAAEFVCTSIASTFLAIDPRPADFIVRESVKADNPHIEFFNGLFRGYCVCDVDRERWRTTFRAVGDPGAVAADPSPLALVPLESSPVFTDAVLELAAGFAAPGRDERIETRQATFPLRT